MSFDALLRPLENLDAWLTGLLEGAPVLVAIAIAFVLGLRHASDPDHLVAVTSLVAADDGDVRRATRLGAWWGLGHALCLRRGAGSGHRHVHVRTPRQALAIGLLHGLAGTGAVVLLLVAALPGRLEAALALAVFAPMSILSMTLFATAFAWIFTRRVVEPVYRVALIPAIGAFGLFFGIWSTGIA
jgi:ABC-type nickel/cobalt efflux system permease component RcnA